MMKTHRRFSSAVCLAFASMLTGASAQSDEALAIQMTESGPLVQWSFPGVLQSSSSLGSWSDIPQAVTSSTVLTSETSMFFRVKKTSFTVVDTAQEEFYNNLGTIAEPAPGQPFYGQDPEFDGPAPSYTDNGDGTITTSKPA